MPDPLRPRLVFEASSWTLVEHRFYELALLRGLRHIREDSWPTSAAAHPKPDGAVMTRSVTADRRHEGVLELAGGLLAYELHQGDVSVRAAAADHAALRRLEGAARELFAAKAVEERRQVDLRLWSMGPRDADHRNRTVEVPCWEDIAANYTATTRAALDRLHRDGLRPDGRGRLLVFNGLPGTGKTHALRSLAWAWRDWCRLDYVVDPESLLGGPPSYLLDVLTEDDETDGRWNLLVLEDTGELLQPDARERAGQGLSRLLNVLDGLLGQGTRTLTLLTTNEPLGSLHPAVVRPGRCAAQVEFGPLRPAEVDAWCAARSLASPGRSATLAELFAAAGGAPPVGPAVRRPVGFAAAGG